MAVRALGGEDETTPSSSFKRRERLFTVPGCAGRHDSLAQQEALDIAHLVAAGGRGSGHCTKGPPPLMRREGRGSYGVASKSNGVLGPVPTLQSYACPLTKAAYLEE